MARIDWRGPNTYDDYERVAEALFDSIVRDALANAQALQDAYPSGRYGVHEPGVERSRILVNNPDERLAFFYLETTNEAFDTIVCQRIDEEGKEISGQVRIALSGATFVYEARFAAAPPSLHDSITVDL